MNDLFDKALREHLEIWGKHCGAPLSVYSGHLRILLREAQASELDQLGQWVRAARGYNRDDATDEIARAIENRARWLRTKEAK